jgi:hypothetical protein
MSTADSTPVLADRNSLARAGGTLLTATQGVAFWAGIAMSFAQVPLLAAGVTSSRPELLVALLVVNVLAMAAGSGYRA